VERALSPLESRSGHIEWLSGRVASNTIRDGERCVVEAEWPDGTIEKIEAFQHEFEAADWIASQSPGWLLEQTMLD
jgi:hypothetical protein